MPYLIAVGQTIRAYAQSSTEKLCTRVSPFKVTQGCTNWLIGEIYDFLLTFHSSCLVPFRRYSEMLAKICKFLKLNPYLMPYNGNSPWNWATADGLEKQEWLGYQDEKKFDDIFRRFDTIHECDKRTDRRTDRHRPTASTALLHGVVR